MHTNLVYRLATVLATTTLLGAGFPATARAAAFPALNAPATTENHPGKFVWAELHTADYAGRKGHKKGVCVNFSSGISISMVIPSIYWMMKKRGV